MSAAHPPRPRKAVVPLAGLGTRHFPASHAVKKELFPVVGPDGISRALFHYHLIELVAAGGLPRSEYKSKLVDRP